MFEQPWGDGCGVVSSIGKAWSEVVISNAASVWETVHAFPYSTIDVSVCICICIQVVLGPELAGNSVLSEPYVGGFRQFVVQEKILYVDAGSTGSRCG